jgi:flavin-dependent dehydrogenase
MKESTQVLVIGGGPGGSSAATMLARQGIDVVLLERDFFPREHIGESLLPSAMDILDVLGVREKVEAHGFVRKFGLYFEWGPDTWSSVWGKSTDPAPMYSFQVVRAEFDQILLEHARSQGVSAYEGIEVTGLEFDGERPRRAAWRERGGEGRSGEISFDWLVDASGRAGIMSNRYLHNRRFNKAFQSVAAWGYWKNVPMPPQAPEGAVTVAAVEDGWVWLIPLHDGTMSVGLVLHKNNFKARREGGEPLERLYRDGVMESELVAGLLRDGELVSPVSAEQDFSYLSERSAGPGYFMVGDSACFLDPLLASGIHLATYSALLAAASIASTLRGEVAEDEAIAYYESTYRQAYVRFMLLVTSLYQEYRGKNTLFWQAKQLTRGDVREEDLMQAFARLVTGSEDMRFAREGEGVLSVDEVQQFINGAFHEARQVKRETLMAMPEDERQAVIAKVKIVNSPLDMSLSPEHAVGGLYVRTEPRLGLVRAEADAPLASTPA